MYLIDHSTLGVNKTVSISKSIMTFLYFFRQSHYIAIYCQDIGTHNTEHVYHAHTCTYNVYHA